CVPHPACRFVVEAVPILGDGPPSSPRRALAEPSPERLVGCPVGAIRLAVPVTHKGWGTVRVATAAALRDLVDGARARAAVTHATSGSRGAGAADRAQRPGLPRSTRREARAVKSKRALGALRGAQRSPSSAMRAGTLSMRKSSISKPRATSAQVTGVDTGARGRGRTEH